jgi:hypothetical protein
LYSLADAHGVPRITAFQVVRALAALVDAGKVSAVLVNGSRHFWLTDKQREQVPAHRLAAIGTISDRSRPSALACA